MRVSGGSRSGSRRPDGPAFQPSTERGPSSAVGTGGGGRAPRSPRLGRRTDTPDRLRLFPASRGARLRRFPGYARCCHGNALRRGGPRPGECGPASGVGVGFGACGKGAGGGRRRSGAGSSWRRGKETEAVRGMQETRPLANTHRRLPQDLPARFPGGTGFLKCLTVV